MKKQGFLQCSAILIISVIVSKAVGALFRIPLANLIGGVGMGYFGGAYGLFLPIYAVFVTGLSSASARLMAESSVLYGASGEKAVKKYSLRSFGVVGVIGTVVIIVLARPFCMYIIESQQVYISVLGAPEKGEAAVECLKKAAGFSKRRINSRIKMRKMPELIFLVDKSLDYYDKMSRMLDNLPKPTTEETDDGEEN